MYRSLILSLFWLTSLAGVAAAQEWLTDYERSGYAETPRYQQTVEFCRKLDDYSPYALFTDFGTSPQGRKLPLLIIDKDREFDPAGPRTQAKAIILIQGGIHSGEIEGKDAGLTLLRDFLIYNKFSDAYDSVVILFIPIFSVDAHERFGPYNRINQNGPREMGWRTTATNLNLNRDFMKADAPEMQAWLALFNKWRPDFLTDIHTTDGADYQYTISYAIETHPGVAPPLSRWIDDEFLPFITQKMTESQFPLIPYVQPIHGHDYARGIGTYAFPPRFSNGYGAIQNRPIMLIETHMLKPYRDRVRSTYEFLRHLIRFCNDNVTALKRAVAESDRLSAETLVGRYLPIDFRRTKDSTMIDFFGVEYRYEDSPISGGKKVVWGQQRQTYRLPVFDRQATSDSIMIPYAYLVPQEWSDIIARLQWHGIKVRQLREAIELPVELYRLNDREYDSVSFEGRLRVGCNTQPFRQTQTFPAGTAVVVMNQRTSRVAAHLLEPKAPDSFLRWGFFNAVFEQKEYAEDYIMELIAPQMLEADSLLRREFETRLASDSVFAARPDQRLNFFYERSPYWDQQLNLYPVARLIEKRDLPLE